MQMRRGDRNGRTVDDRQFRALQYQCLLTGQIRPGGQHKLSQDPAGLVQHIWLSLVPNAWLDFTPVTAATQIPPLVPVPVPVPDPLPEEPLPLPAPCGSVWGGVDEPSSRALFETERAG